MKKQKEEEEAAKAANASQTKDESSSEKENLEESKETEKIEVESKEEISSDYLEEEKEEVDYKKRYGDSTREYQTLKGEKDKLSLAIDNLERLSKANPKILAEIEAAQGMEGSSTLIQKKIDKALEPIKKVVQGQQDSDRRAKIGVLIKLEEKNPKFFSKLTKEKKKVARQRIGLVANALTKTGLSYKQAVKQAFFSVNPKAAVQKGKDEAYLEGLDEKQAGFSSQASTEGKKSGKSKYTKAELEVAKKLGSNVYKAMIKETK